MASDFATTLDTHASKSQPFSSQRKSIRLFAFQISPNSLAVYHAALAPWPNNRFKA